MSFKFEYESVRPPILRVRFHKPTLSQTIESVRINISPPTQDEWDNPEKFDARYQETVYVHKINLKTHLAEEARQHRLNKHLVETKSALEKAQKSGNPRLFVYEHDYLTAQEALEQSKRVLSETNQVFFPDNRGDH